jgi:hypothetical protein
MNWSDDYIEEHAYLVERGVRPLALVGHVPNDKPSMLQAASKLETISVNMRVVPFVVARRDGFADCGFAAAKWVVDLYTWVVQSKTVPKRHLHRIRGLLLSYSAEAIRTHDERGSGRRFTSSPERESRSPSCRKRGRAEIRNSD